MSTFNFTTKGQALKSGFNPAKKFDEIGDNVEGYLRKVELGIGDFDCPLYTFETSEGFVGVWGSTSLRNIMENPENKIVIGNPYRVTYVGSETSDKTGNTMKMFQVEPLQNA